MRASKLSWGSEAEIILLDFYRDNEQLWNSKHQNYYDRDVRDRTLQQLVVKLGLDYGGIPYTVNDIKYKIKNLRATFGRELMKCAVMKRRAQAQAQGGCTYVPRWRHYNRMMFLINCRKPRDAKNRLNELEDESCSSNNEDNLGMFCEIEIEEDGVKLEKNEQLIDRQQNGHIDQDISSKIDHQSEVELLEDKRKSNLREIVLAVESERNVDPMMFHSINDHLDINDHLILTHSRRGSGLQTPPEEPISFAANREDSEYHFCMSLAENLRKMESYQRESAKIELQKVMIKFMFPEKN